MAGLILSTERYPSYRASPALIGWDGSLCVAIGSPSIASLHSTKYQIHQNTLRPCAGRFPSRTFLHIHHLISEQYRRRWISPWLARCNVHHAAPAPYTQRGSNLLCGRDCAQRALPARLGRCTERAAALGATDHGVRGGRLRCHHDAVHVRRYVLADARRCPLWEGFRV